mgnify:CR=1 FL=1
MNKQWMALLLSAGMAVTTCPVPGAQEPPAEQIHTEQAEESSAAVHSDDSDREGTAADEFQSETEPSGSETETGAYEEETSKMKIRKTTEPCWIYRPCVLIFRKLQKQRK